MQLLDASSWIILDEERNSILFGVLFSKKSTISHPTIADYDVVTDQAQAEVSTGSRLFFTGDQIFAISKPSACVKPAPGFMLERSTNSHFHAPQTRQSSSDIGANSL